MCCVCDSVCETIITCLIMIVILLLNVMMLFSMVGGALLNKPFIVFQRECVLCLESMCASICSFHMFICGFVCCK